MLIHSKSCRNITALYTLYVPYTYTATYIG